MHYASSGDLAAKLEKEIDAMKQPVQLLVDEESRQVTTLESPHDEGIQDEKPRTLLAIPSPALANDSMSNVGQDDEDDKEDDTFNDTMVASAADLSAVPTAARSIGNDMTEATETEYEVEIELESPDNDITKQSSMEAAAVDKSSNLDGSISPVAVAEEEILALDSDVSHEEQAEAQYSAMTETPFVGIKEGRSQPAIWCFDNKGRPV